LASPEFAAWVPTITGHLSFSFVGHGVNGCLAANSETTDAFGKAVRRVLVLQHRTMRDLPYTRWPMAVIRPWIAADYLMIGVSSPAERPAIDSDGHVSQKLDEMGVLSGELIVLPYHEDRGLRREARMLLGALRRELARFSDAAPRGVPVDIDALDRSVRDDLSKAEGKGVRLIKANFSLHRTGEFRLRMTQTPPLKGAPPGSKAAATYEEILARQIYYFAKDVAHRHYHHEPSADNLLPLTVAPANDDQTWRRETLWSLARAVLEVRRRDQLSDYKGAIGMLAYAEAFQALMGRVMRTRAGRFVPTTRIVPYDFAHTRSSLEAKIDERAWISSGWSQFWTLLLTTALAAVALWIGGVQIRDAACSIVTPPPHAAAELDRDYNVSVRSTVSPTGPPPAALASKLEVLVAPQPEAKASACPDRPRPPRWAAKLVLNLVNDPGALIGLMALGSLLYFEFARRSLRSVRASRFLVSSPWEWLSALGSTVSRRVRPVAPLWGDRIGMGVAVLSALAILGAMSWWFVILL
jgi:hypothetical protein